MVYNYTKPRGPIAAMFNSPGPCYALPSLIGYHHHDPRSVHSRGPAFPLAGRFRGPDTGSDNPGPAAYVPDPKTFRTGRDPGRRFSLAGKLEDRRGCRSATPGPAAYSPEKAGPTARRCITPSFSFGVKQRPKLYEDMPAPNQYEVPSMLCRTVQSDKRQAPSFSLVGRGRCAIIEDRRTPGPGTYSVTELSKFKPRPPSCRLGERCMPPADDTVKPGPGAHYPERVMLTKRISPSYSFGIRHSQYTAPMISSYVEEQSYVCIEI